MGRRRVDRSNKIMQTFESTKPLKVRLIKEAETKKITLSALIRMILEQHYEERKND